MRNASLFSVLNYASKRQKGKLMANVQKYGDEMLTAYVNKEFEKVMQIWSSMGHDINLTIEAHQYSNPAITDVATSRAILYAHEAQDDSPRPPSPIEMHENGWATQSEYDAILKELRLRTEWPCETPIWDSIQERTKHLWDPSE